MNASWINSARGRLLASAGPLASSLLFAAPANAPKGIPRTVAALFMSEERSCIAREHLRTEADWRKVIDTMDRKRPGWIRGSERALIVNYVLANFLPRQKR